MKVLVACEYSGRVRDAFRKLGHTAVSCDLLPSDTPGPHIQGSVLEVLDWGWELMVAHPPCTYLAVSGMHWTTRGLRDPQLTEDALQFVQELLDAPIPKIALENPVSVISSRIRKPDQIIQPWWFGDDASKKTCLWLKGLPKLQFCSAQVFPPKGWNVVRFASDMEMCDCCEEPLCEIHQEHFSECACLGPTADEAAYKEVDGVLFGTTEFPVPKMLWGNQTPSGQNSLGPSDDRAKIRSLTYQGIADAMAAQWGTK